MSKTALLQSVSLFQGIQPQDLTVLAQTLVVRRYRAGQLIFQQGDVGSTMYIIFEGQVSIYLTAAPNNLPLQTMAPGEHFGELALFDQGPRSANALALTDVMLLGLTRQHLTAFILKRPHVALTLLATLSARLRATNSLLSQRATRNVAIEVDQRLTWQDRLADQVAALNGSWAFIIVLMGVVMGWFLVNDGAVFRPPFDPYPFVFFNLLLAILVALQGPLIVMSQNRQSLKDRVQAETDFRVNLKNEVNIERLLHEISRLSVQLNDRLQQLESDSHGASSAASVAWEPHSAQGAQGPEREACSESSDRQPC